MATQSEYDAGNITDRERKAAENQIDLAKKNADDVRNQVSKQLETYDYANRQNRSLADVQLKQNSRKNSADRFEAQRDLQNATLGLLGSMGNAMNGSSTGNLMRMLENRNDKDNNTYWAQHQVNQDTVENSYQDSYNQNQVAKRDAVTSAEKAIRDIESDLSANLNNINPNLYTKPGTGDADLNSGSVWNDNANGLQQANARISGYVMPDNRNGAQRNQLRQGDYFSRLVNRFHGREHMGSEMPFDKDIMTLFMGLKPDEPGQHGPLEVPVPTEQAIDTITKIRDLCEQFLQCCTKEDDGHTATEEPDGKEGKAKPFDKAGKAKPGEEDEEKED